MRPSRADSTRDEARTRTTVWLVLAICAVASLACAGRTFREGVDGRLTHRELGYSIDTPRFGGDPAWQRIDLERTDLAWRRVDGRSMSLASSCRRTRAKPALLARRLLIGVPKDELLSAHPIALLGDPGWAQVVETGKGSEAVRIKTVTVVSAGCIFDWVLVAGAGPRFDETLPIFDAWWTSFERSPRARAAETAGETKGETTGETTTVPSTSATDQPGAPSDDPSPDSPPSSGRDADGGAGS